MACAALGDAKRDWRGLAGEFASRTAAPDRDARRSVHALPSAQPPNTCPHVSGGGASWEKYIVARHCETGGHRFRRSSTLTWTYSSAAAAARSGVAVLAHEVRYRDGLVRLSVACQHHSAWLKTICDGLWVGMLDYHRQPNMHATRVVFHAAWSRARGRRNPTPCPVRPDSSVDYFAQLHGSMSASSR